MEYDEDDYDGFDPDLDDNEEEPDIPDDDRPDRKRWSPRPVPSFVTKARQDRGDLLVTILAAIVLAIVLVVVFAIVAWVIAILDRKQSRTTQSSPTQSAPVGTMRKIKANQLNLRSGPGKNHPVVKVFTRNESIVTVGDPQNINGELWIQASTPDGRTRGWIARRFLDP